MNGGTFIHTSKDTEYAYVDKSITNPSCKYIYPKPQTQLASTCKELLYPYYQSSKEHTCWT